MQAAPSAICNEINPSVPPTSSFPHVPSIRLSDRDEVVKQGDHLIRLLQERLSERAAAEGDASAFLTLPKSREAVREGVRVLDKGHDDVRGGWAGGRGGMKFPQVNHARIKSLARCTSMLRDIFVVFVRLC